MHYPGERFYPEGVRWDEPIETGLVPELLEEAARRFGDRPAIEFRAGRISYRDLSDKAAQAAAAYLRDGLGRDTTIGLFLGNTPDHPINFFGALKAGARIVHLSPLDGEITLKHKLTDSDARVVVTSNLSSIFPRALAFLDAGVIDRIIVCEDDVWGESENKLVSYARRPEIVTYSDFTAGASLPAAWPALDRDDVALLQYTGGTTGLPKGAMLTHRNLTAAVSIREIWTRSFRAKRKAPERVICALPLFHIYALTLILMKRLRYGDLISLHQRFDLDEIMRDIEVNRATVFPGVPTMWIAVTSLRDLDRRDLSSLALCSSGGAPLPVEVAAILERKTGLRLRSGWGMTETSSPGTTHPSDGPDKPASIGLMLPGIEIAIVAQDDPHRVLPIGEVGELIIRGPNVTRGYWKREAERSEWFIGDRFLTGDIGYMDADGWFYLVDRKKDLIISGGFNVYPQLIEQAIYTHPDVHEVMVIGIPDQYRGEAAKAYITLRPGAAPFEIDDLRTFLSGKIGKHELPSALDFVEDLPRTNVGKLSRQALRDRLSSRSA
ncbi:MULTISPECIES: dicarboxylate--CoA ligase PimA [Rhodopseudomonas]|uniref:Long-chain-fatty-acid--CoA ligase n=1 Tax=Rhodopseudomonas palustris TaxID=1076 RepID=A0A0D7EZF5_RHOPL|nr:MULTISPECIES: dicarboxylate--CoA ligase PimA [Rhodopseudomonas]KIZ45991.1 AMP-dependent synthetase [Rhodopseudomonas palustris]MDF3811028.1 dicarboxylate--CoA ligase PimA [Rhodopseudomonas sp. BAL398]WOK15925.1 dicarboxylate--CoA ligase PimA [Rhodopseudomonas sp. BAL398]